MPLTGQLACGRGDVECPAPFGRSDTPLNISESDGALTVAYGSHPPATVVLPQGYTVGATCCADNCCAGQ